METTIISAFTIGLLGSTHCLGMCGGIVGTINAAKKHTDNTGEQLVFNLCYNAGRITSYVVAGGLIGLAGSLISQSTLMSAAPVGRLTAGLIMIVLGLYLAGWPQLLAPVEKIGFHLWKLIQPFGRHFLPANSPPQAYGLGLVWGWLPCGLVLFCTCAGRDICISCKWCRDDVCIWNGNTTDVTGNGRRCRSTAKTRAQSDPQKDCWRWHDVIWGIHLLYCLKQ